MPIAQYPTNLAELAGGVAQGPYSMARQQFDTAMQNEQLNQRAALQQLLFDEENNPLKLEDQRLKNQGKGYENRSLGVKASTDEALMPSAIESGVAGNQAAAQKARVENMAKLAEMGGQLADMIDGGVPVLSLVGKVPDQVYQILSQPGGTKKIRAIAQQIAKNSAAQLQKMQEVDASNASAERRNKYTADTQMGIEQAGIAAGKYNRAGKGGTSWYEKFQAAKTPREKHTIASTQALLAEQEGDMDAAKKWSQIANQAAEAWAAELRAGQRPGVDPAATANSGVVTPAPAASIPTVGSQPKPDPLGIRK